MIYNLYQKAGKRKPAGRKEYIMDLSNVVIAVVILACIVMVLLATRYTTDQKGFDEMQLKKRGDAFRIGFFTLLACVLLMLFLNSLDSFAEKVTVDFMLIASIMITACVFGVYSIWKDAFFRMNENPKTYLGICFAVVFPNAIVLIGELKQHGTLLKDGKVTFTPCGNLLNVVTFTIIAITIIIKMIVNRREEKE